jgi:hypothetical protein
MIKLNKSIAVLLVFTATFVSIQSCKKVTLKKIEGDWEMSKGVEKKSSTGVSGNVYEETVTYDGTTQTITQTLDGVLQLPANEALPFTMSIKFNKKSGTYEKVIVHSKTLTNSTVYTFKKSDSGFYDFKTLEQKAEQKYTITEKGIFTVTGGSGEIKKNSQLVLRATSNHQILTQNFFYYDGEIAILTSDRFMYSYQNPNNVIELPVSETSTQNSTGTTSEGIIYDVKELRQGVLEISSKDEETKTVGISTTKVTRETSYTFRER